MCMGMYELCCECMDCAYDGPGYVCDGAYGWCGYEGVFMYGYGCGCDCGWGCKYGKEPGGRTGILCECGGGGGARAGGYDCGRCGFG